MRSLSAAFFALVAALGDAAWGAADPSQPHAPRMQFAPPAAGSYDLQRIQRVPHARLLDEHGRIRTLGNYTRGKVTLLTFFYTYCTDPLGCPFAHTLMTDLRKRLLEQADAAYRVRFVSISFDPAHDTPDALRTYSGAQVRDSRLAWHFLTTRGVQELIPLLDDFGQDVRVETDEHGRPVRTINHMLKLFLIDRWGTVREIYALDYLHPELMINDIRTLLLEEDGRARPP